MYVNHGPASIGFYYKGFVKNSSLSVNYSILSAKRICLQTQYKGIDFLP